jgi:cobalt-zinc-cadmium efflux system protein
MPPHAHKTRAARNQRSLTIALVLAAAYMVAEFLGGLFTGSLALLADAGHMLSDVFALAMSVVAIRIAQLPATPQRTYGYQRTEILAALGHGVLLICIAIYILTAAFTRAATPVEVRGLPMFAIAVGGLIVNAAGLVILNAGKRDNLNIRGAWLHVLSDALGSLGAIIAGVLIWQFGWMWADSAASVLIALMVIYSAWQLLSEAVAVLMEEAPPHIDVDEVRQSMLELPGVIEVHDLHVWTVGSGMVSLSGHVVASDGFADGSLLRSVSGLLAQRFQIEHATIQVEPQDFEEPASAHCH